MRGGWLTAVVLAAVALAALWAPPRSRGLAASEASNSQESKDTSATQLPPPGETPDRRTRPPASAVAAAVVAGPMEPSVEAADDSVFLGRERVLQQIEAQDVAGLLAVDVSDGYAAAEAIAGLGAVGSQLDVARRAPVRQRLTDLLRAEARRDGPGAGGNASIAVEALEMLGDSESASALARALSDDAQPIYRRTMIVKALERMGFTSGKTQVANYKSYLDGLGPIGDEFESELWKESVDACDSALISFEKQR